MSTVRSVPTLVLMLKAPRLGTVKTRLAAALGDDEALRIYRQLVEHQCAALPPSWPIEIHHAPGDAVAAHELRTWLGAHYTYHPQCGGDLGARLTHALAGAFTRRPAGVIVIGGDCPQLDTTALRAAAAELAPGRVVLGPTGDGGYHLLGLSAPQPELFTAMPWSTPELLAATQARAAALGLAVALRPVLDDVDTHADWQRLAPALATHA